MSDDSEYVEGDASSEAADAPPSDAPRGGSNDVIDSASVQDAPVQKIAGRRSADRLAASRKAFAEAVLANKAKPAAAPAAEPEPDPEAEAEEPDAAPAAAAAPAAVTPPPVAAPPAPSLDPEVRKLKEQLAAERKAIEAERAELEKRKAEPPPADALSLEEYIDSPPRAFRTWLEAMRGEKFASDDDFKAEVKDFITATSTDVLGVPLPENVRAQFDAAQAKKIVTTHKKIQTRREAQAAAKAEAERAAAAERAEAERIEQEWGNAASVLSQQFSPTQDATGKPEASAAAKAYPWLAAEEEPGRIVVDVIRAALTKDGTQLSWQEASKRANDYLAEQAKSYYDRRKALLSQSPAAPAPVAKPKVAAVTPPPPAPPAPVHTGPWKRDKHMESTLAAFRNARLAAEKTE